MGRGRGRDHEAQGAGVGAFFDPPQPFIRQQRAHAVAKDDEGFVEQIEERAIGVFARFDEIGVRDFAHAPLATRELYRANFDRGRKGFGPLRERGSGASSVVKADEPNSSVRIGLSVGQPRVDAVGHADLRRGLQGLLRAARRSIGVRRADECRSRFL